MRKPISTQMHGAIDYLSVIGLATLPKLLGFSPTLTRAMQTVAVGKLVYTLFTDNELGVVRAIPMKAHLAMDAVGGAALAALPFVLEEDDPTAMGVCIGMGAFEILNAPMTQTTPGDHNYPRELAESATDYGRRGVRQIREAVAG